jgi:hypothetical protein
MKKTIMVLAVIIALVLASCETTDFSTNQVGWSDYADIAVKDFESLGIVTLQAQEQIGFGPFQLTRYHTGSRVTYAGLFEEAKKLGADEIINVRIDVRTEEVTSPVDFFTGGKATHTYTGTALAIKYTGAMEQVKSNITGSINTEEPTE